MTGIAPSTAVGLPFRLPPLFGPSAISRDGLLSYPRGVNYIDATNSETDKRSVYPGISNATPQPGQSLEFTGVEYVTVPTTTLVGDFVIVNRFLFDSGSVYQSLYGGDDTTEGTLKLSSSNRPYFQVNGTTYDFTTITALIDIYYSVTVSRTSNQLTITLTKLSDSSIQTETQTVSTANFVIKFVGDFGTGAKFNGNIYDLSAYDSNSVRVLHVSGAKGASATDAYVPALPSAGTVVGATVGTFFHEHQDGYGFNPNILGYTVADGATLYRDTGGSNLYAANDIIPAHPDQTDKCVGYTAAGAFATLDNGPIKLNPIVKSVNCATADGTAYLAVTEIAGTEAVTSSSGTSTPSISAGKIEFTAGTCWDLLLDNGSFYPLEDGATGKLSPTANDTVNGYVGTWTSGTLSNVWTDNTRTGRSWNVERGFTVAANAYVPASSTDPTLDALGNALTNGPQSWNSAPVTYVMPKDARLIAADIIGQGGNDPINFFFEPDGDQREFSQDDLLPTYGAELFASPATGTGWTDNADGTYTCDGSQVADSELALTVSLDASDFQLDLTIISVSAGAITFTTVGDVSKTDDIDAVGGYTQEFTTDGTDDAVVAGNATFAGTIRVALREITATGANINDQNFFGSNGLALYDEPQSATDVTRIERAVRV